jgi:putative endopeptidase
MDKSLKKLIGLSLALGVLSISCKTEEVAEAEAPKANLGFDVANLDTSMSPCSDFYQYIAGGWIKNNPIPSTESRWSNFNILVENNNKKVRTLLDSVAGLEANTGEAYVQHLATYYKSGLDSMAVEEAGLAPLQEVFDRINAMETSADYAALLGYLKSKGIGGPMRSSVGVDDKNSSVHVLNLAQSGIGLPDRDYYLQNNERFEKIRTAYKQHIAKMLEFTGVFSETEQLAGNIYAFEKALAEVSMPRTEMRKPELTYNKKSFADITSLYPDLALETYFKHNAMAFDSAIVNQPDYLTALSGILKAQSVETLKAYAVWSSLNAYAGYLPHAYVKQDFDFYSTTIRGTKEMKPRWKRTVNAVEQGLGEQVGHLFVDRYFPEDNKLVIQNLVENLRTAYRERIKQLSWMSEETKEKALEKLMGFTYKIGYPDKWDAFEGLEVNSAVYLENAMAIKAYSIKENIQKLKKEVDRNEWFMPAHIVNAYYNPSFNEVVFPAGILQPPFFNPEADMAINFGGIGGVIGHEFSHGFDDQGSKYNVEGNLENWWTDMDSTSFSERTGLMVAQYGAYEPILESFVNGELTLGENIADLGGLTLGYYGYKAGMENGDYSGEDIDGFTWQQRIFMGWGQVWQVNQTDEATRNQVLTDPHSPARYRVIGPMSNMPEFAQAWGCSPGDEMVRAETERVEIW